MELIAIKILIIIFSLSQMEVKESKGKQIELSMNLPK